MREIMESVPAKVLTTTLLLGLFTIAEAAPPAKRVMLPVRVVYQLNEGGEQTTRALRNIRNQLEDFPRTRVVVVAYGAGIDFLIEGATDSGGYPYELLVQPLIEGSVEFKVCERTLKERGIEKDKILKEARFVSSGAAELARLQFEEGYAYLKP